VLIAAAIFAFRYPAAFTLANIYGEDAKVFIQNILDHSLVGAPFAAFNGYLVVGLYVLAELAFVVVSLTALPFSSLPIVIAIVSCLTLGLLASLPFLLLRRQMGAITSLVCVLLLAFVPMPFSDADVIGTIGNLKFAFVFLAFVLIVYRAYWTTCPWRVVVVDLALLVCVLTNVLVVALLPFVFLPTIREAWSRLRGRDFRGALTFERVSAVALCFVSAAYLVVVVLKGVPKYPGYLDAPFQAVSTMPVVSHSTVYAFLYPFWSATTGKTVAVVLGLIVLWAVAMRPGRRVFVFGMWAIGIATVGFVFNRPGIGTFMAYGNSPDQFFYAQTMIFTFIVVWFIGARLTSRRARLGLATVALVFVVAAAPFGSSFGLNAGRYAPQIGTFERNVAAACAVDDHKAFIDVGIYPMTAYRWQLPRSLACEDGSR
jgi:hypothetical protein